jgi:hypothetical protein
MTLRDEQKLGAARITDLASCNTLARQSRRVDVSGPSLCGPYSLLDAPSASHLDRIAAGDPLLPPRGGAPTAVTQHISQPYAAAAKARRKSLI